MTSAKLANSVRSYELGGVPYRVGKLTLGAALQIEEHLSKLKTPLEIYRDSGILSALPTEKSDDILNRAAQETMFWPPDAVTALSDGRFLRRAEFGIAFISALLAAYNPGLSPHEITLIAQKASIKDVLQLQVIAFGADVIDPKDERAASPAETIPDAANE